MLIFLDIDGVMVSAKSWQQPELLADGFPAFSQTATQILQHFIADETKVILTTSHKSRYTVDQWKDIFQKRGVIIRNLDSLPSNAENLTKKEELMRWFHCNMVNEDFIIIDDDRSLNGLPDHLKRHLVQTTPYAGLTGRDMVDAGYQAPF